MGVFITQSIICQSGEKDRLCSLSTKCIRLLYPEHASYVTTSICWINTRRNVYYKKSHLQTRLHFPSQIKWLTQSHYDKSRQTSLRKDGIRQSILYWCHYFNHCSKRQLPNLILTAHSDDCSSFAPVFK